MGTSVMVIDRTHGHLARDSEEHIRAPPLGSTGGTYWC